MQQKISFFTSWRWRINRIDIACFILLISISSLMVATASTAIAERIGVAPFYFIQRQIIFILLSIFIIFFFSALSPRTIRIMSFLGYIGCIFLLIAVLVLGHEIKGSRRWLNVYGINLQPSEIIKPFFIVLSAWFLSKRYTNPRYPAYRLSALLHGLLAILLLLQPDFGMMMMNLIIWGTQLFIAGLSLLWIGGLFLLGITILIICYFYFPHVANRINKFLYPNDYENYQIKKSLEAFKTGGLLGRGPGEGSIKQHLPDSHADFIFAVIGEEFGIITCILIIMLFSFIIIRNLLKLTYETDYFKILTIVGILMQFGAQSIINMGVTLNLLPNKGTTLPFISYGGSSMISWSILAGILLALTKKHFDWQK